MNIDKARAVAAASIAHPNEAQTASLVVLLAILDRLDALTAAPIAAQPIPDEKPRKGKADR